MALENPEAPRRTGLDEDETDSVWTDMIDWLARFPGGAGVEDKVRLIHNEGALPSFHLGRECTDLLC